MNTVKQECAAALLGKEKSNQQKNKELETQIVDLKFEIQKYIQKINDLEAQNSKQSEDFQDQFTSQLKEKDKVIKNLKSQRDCIHAEIQALKQQIAAGTLESSKGGGGPKSMRDDIEEIQVPHKIEMMNTQKH